MAQVPGWAPALTGGRKGGRKLSVQVPIQTGLVKIINKNDGQTVVVIVPKESLLV
jgi:hypothetical protein